jgi:hypothetical protein
MRISIVIGALASVLALALAVSAAESRPSGDYQPRIDKDGWEILFDGKGLDAWTPASRAGVWSVNAEGELYPNKPGGDLCTRRRYCDYVVELDFKMGAKRKANSGVMIRAHDPNDDVNTGMEVQILDNDDYHVPFNARNANGALYDLVRPAVDANKPVGEWNHYRITVNQSLVVVELNGKEIVRADLSRWVKAHQNPAGGHNKFPHAIGELPREGFILLQNYGATPVWFRAIRLKSLSDRKPQYTGKEPVATVLQKAPAAEK